MRLELSRVLSPPRREPLHRRFLPIPEAEASPRLASPKRPRGLYSGEPENCRRARREFLPVLIHLGLLLAVAKVYRLEGRAFGVVLTVATVALPIHYLLPYRLKKPGFLAASLIGLGLVFGATTAAIVSGMGLALIALARLPIAWTARAAAMTGAASLLALARAGTFGSPVPAVVWPVLGSMFMFRMILYLYELKHAEGPETALDALCYFFLLPNLCFLHFPVVDYRNFRRGYFSREVHESQRAGLRMMVRGTLHLLAYRLIGHQWLPLPDEVHSVPSLMLFVGCNYLTYLRVSGQFHMACGLLHLFGFSLPETHHNYLLATGFTDYWRRINIYWKDFMVRVVFNPTVFRLKRHGQAAALAAATAVVFVVTWALHAYQAFWLRGRWGFSAQDALFWGVLGGLVLVNVQMDARAPRRAKPKGARLTPREWIVRGAKTAGTFATIAVLWSLWYAPSVGDWLAMWRRSIG